MGCHRGIDAALNFGLTGQMDTRQHVSVVVRHDLLHDVAGPDFLAVDDARNLEHVCTLTGEFGFQRSTLPHSRERNRAPVH